MTDAKLITALEQLEQLKLYPNMRVNVNLTEEEYVTIVKNPFIKNVLDGKYAASIKVLDAWVATPEEDRDPAKRPFWGYSSARMPQRIVWFYSDSERLHGKIVPSTGEEIDIDICPVSECTQSQGSNMLAAYNNPNASYLYPVFVHDLVPPYYHELAIWQQENNLNVMRSTDGQNWGESLEPRE